MSPLTYERLVASINSMIKMIPVEIPGDENIQRRAEVLVALQATLATTRAGLESEENVQSPGQLKHGLQAKINEIHERFEQEQETEQPMPKLKLKPAASGASAPGSSLAKKKEMPETIAVTMKRVLRSTNAGVKKTPAKKTVKTVRTVSASSSSTSTTTTTTSSLQTQEVTAEDRKMAILVMQLSKPKTAPTWRSDELEAANSMIEFAKQSKVFSQPAQTSQPFQRNVARSFWNVI